MQYDTELAKAYNHDSFAPGKFDRFWNYKQSPQLGKPAPDYLLWHLDRGEETTLCAELARHPLTVVEFGSLSCPMSRMACDPLEELADNYSESGAGALFIYTHEAHPSEKLPMHTSWQDKLELAQRLRELSNPVRPILIDALDGACHCAYGGMPNMTWIFNAGGEPVYKAEWTAPANVERALQSQLELRRPLGEHEAIVLHACEMVMGVRVDIREHDCILEDNSDKALQDFRNSFGDWPERILWPSRMSRAMD